MEIPPKGCKRGCGWTAAVALVGIIGLSFTTSGPFRSVSGKGESASEANARLWNCSVPDDATDVWYISSYRATKVECTLSAESFEAWCKRWGWRLTPITEDNPQYIASQRDGYRTVKTITKGFRFSEMDEDVGFYGLYDSDGRHAYVTYSGN